MSADSTAYNITHYVVDAVTVSALAIDECPGSDINYCSDRLYEYLKNSQYTSASTVSIVYNLFLTNVSITG